MNKLEFDREQLLALWNSSYSLVQQMQPFLQKPPEYYYHSGVLDACRAIFGEKQLTQEKENNVDSN